MNDRARFMVVAVLLLACVTLACGGNSPSSDEPVTPAPTRTLRVHPTLEPTNTAEPSPVPTVDTSSCTFDAAFQTDLTVPDNTRVEGGQVFTKTWRIRNTGTCTWGLGYQWTFIDGEQMDGPDSVNVPETSPGDSVEISVSLVAPVQQGQHRGYWQMCVNENQCFGTRMYVQIVSVATLASSPESTPTLRIVTTSKGSFAIPGFAFLDGRDLGAIPPLTVMNINIWDGVPRQRVLCVLRHGTSIDVLDAEFYEAEDRYYFHVRSGSCDGWVSEPFLSLQYYPPEGDEMP